MVNLIVNIIGILLIIISIYFIRKDLKYDNNVIDEINLIEDRVKEYYNLTEEIVESFDEIVDAKLTMLNKNKANKNKDIQVNNPTPVYEESNTKIDLFNITDTERNISNSFHKKVLELNSIGLSTKEIAKKLNKGVYEIDIVLKMYSFKNIDKKIQK